MEDLGLIPRNKELLGSILGLFLSKFPDLPPHIGHAQAGYCPDIPFLKWTYEMPGESPWTKMENAGVQLKKGKVLRNNAEIASAAVAAVAEASAQVPGLKPARDAQQQISFFTPDLFRKMDSLKGRSAQWMDLFFTNRFFDFRKPDDRERFSYDGKEWLGKAIGPISQPRGSAVLSLRKGYTNADWWKFQQAARWCGRQCAVK